MSKRTRKRFTSQEKVAILRLHLLENTPVSDLCDKHGIRPTMFYRWQKEFFENGSCRIRASFSARQRRQGPEDRPPGAEAPTQARGALGADGGARQAKKRTWGALNGRWVPQATRDLVVQFIRHWAGRTGLSVLLLIGWLAIARSKFNRWSRRLGTPNQHNATVPRDFWLEDWEKAAIIAFQDLYPLDVAERRSWFSRTFDDGAPARRLARALKYRRDHAALTTLALSNRIPARPYICRLIVFRRLTCPSTGPLLHRSVIAASTAASSRRMPSANRRISGQEDASPFTSQSLSVPHERLRSRSANSSAKPNAAASSSLPARIASIRLCSLGLRSSGRRTHSNDNCLGDGGGGSDGLAALTRSRFFPAAPNRFLTYRCTLLYEPRKPLAVNCRCKSGTRSYRPRQCGRRSIRDARPIGIAMPVPASSPEALCTAGSAARRCATCQVLGRSDEPSDPADDARGPARTARSSSLSASAGLGVAAIPEWARISELRRRRFNAGMTSAVWPNAGLGGGEFVAVSAL